MTETTPEQGNAFYAEPSNQVPQGPTGPPPCQIRPTRARPPARRFRPNSVQMSRSRAADDRSVSGWIRRGVQHERARSRD